MRWPPVIFTIGTLYFTATWAMRISSSARRHAAVDARDDRERAVLLDVGVDAIVDEAGVALVVVLVGPQRFQQRRQADLAAGIFLAARQLLEDRADGLEAAALDFGDELRFFERHARNVVVLGRVVAHFAETRFQQLRHQALARAAAQAGLGAGADLGDALAALGLNGLDDLPLADAVAIADLRVVGQVRRLKQRHAGRRAEQQVGAARRHLACPAMNICMSVPAASISPSRIAPAISPSRTINLLVDAARGLAIDDDLVGRDRAVWSRPSRPAPRPSPSASCPASSRDRRRSDSCR